MSTVPDNTNGKTYWRSLDEMADTPEFRRFVESEFPSHAEEFLRGDTRRHFLKIMAASFCLAGLTGCRWPKEKIVPYSQRPEETNPGQTKSFATAMEVGGVAMGLLATSYDGRPIKIEGNPDHPFSLGKASAIAQAAILELYDPDRGRDPIEKNANDSTVRSWSEAEAFLKTHFEELKKQGGRGFSILSEATYSPSVWNMRDRLLKAFPEAKWHEYESISDDNERAGTNLAFGEPVRILPQLDQAKVIVSLDADLLGSHPAALKNAADFAKNRNPQDGSMNRLYVVEPRYTITGAMADHRLLLPASKIEEFALALAAELVFTQQVPLGFFFQILLPQLERYKIHSFDAVWIAALAKDLAENRGACLIAAGSHQSPLLHTAVAMMNEMMGCVRKTVVYSTLPDKDRPSHKEAIFSLARDIQAGDVKTLLVLGGNPVYDAPVDLQFRDLFNRVPTTLHLSLYPNETSALATWYLPRAHFLETWGDARAYDGTISLVQPLIEPLYGGKSAIELLALIQGDELLRGYDIVRRSLHAIFQVESFDRGFQYWLHNGYIENTHFEWFGSWYENMAIQKALNERSIAIPSCRPDYLEVVFYPDSMVYDGRFANNGWLQETPDFLTKLTWDNAALIAPETARNLRIEQGDLIRLNCQGRTLEIAAYVMPGQVQNSIALALGYGRTAAGRVGTGVGFDVQSIRTSDTPFFVTGATIEKTGRKYPFAITQDHFAIDAVGRKELSHRIPELIHETTLETYLADPEHFKHQSHILKAALWKEHEYTGNRWGMAIDLNACIGCNACMVACQAENNIPIVGKEGVAKSREMHWIRVDRYFSGNVDSPRIVHQPMACVHCENAPCEQVCPVGATVHSEEGLNVMVYNRCVGTRYCSNNCPFKVRRFNYFNYHKKLEPIEKMMFNPEVTVRSRGVMEKCTYCVQRIEAVKIAAKNNRRAIRDGEIVPACAQTCPTQAIVFGDLNDPNSRVSQRQNDNRAYTMLEELNVKPRTAYLARIRNINPALAEFEMKQSGHS